MANQENSYTRGLGTGTNKRDFDYTFPTFKESEVKVEIDNVVKALTTHYTIVNHINSSGGTVRFNATGLPTGTDDSTPIRIFRQTDVETPKATFTAGSSLKAQEINDNFKQVRHALQEAIGATYDNNGNLTSRKVQRFNIEADAIDGTLIADDVIESEHYAHGSIDNIHVAGNAAIDGTKINPSFGNQSVITAGSLDVNTVDIDGGSIDGTDIGGTQPYTGAFSTLSASGNADFNGNLDVAGTLDVDGNVDFDGNLDVDGALTVTGGFVSDQVTINNAAGNVISTSAGNLLLDSTGGTVSVQDNFSVTGNTTLGNSTSSDDLFIYAGIKSNLTPGQDGTYDVGTTTKKWKNIYADNIQPTNLTVSGNTTLGDSTSDTITVNGLVNTGIFPKLSQTYNLGLQNVRWNEINGTTLNVDAIRLDSATGKLQIGQLPEFELYHNNTDGYIDNNKGDLYIRNNVNDDDNGDIIIEGKSGETSVKCVNDGTTELYYDGNLKLTTTLFGVEVTGDVDLDNITGDAVITSGTSTSNSKVYSAKRSDELYYRKGTADDIEASGVPWSGNDSTVATTAAIDKRIVDIVDDVGGFVPLTDEGEIPQYHPEKENTDTADRVGTILSIGVIAKSGGYTTDNNRRSGTTVTIADGDLTNHAVDATITDCNVDLPEGYGVLVETTAQTDAQYAAGPEFKFHRLVPKATEVTTVAGAQPAISNVSSNLNTISNVNSNLTSGANISNVNSNMSAINTVNTNIGNNVLPSISTNLSIIGNVNSNLTANANISNVNSNMSAIGNVNTQINNGNIAAVAGKETEIGVLAASDVVADMAILGASGVVGNIATVAGQISPTNNINTVATNIADVNNFADRYQIASSNPSTDGGGNALAAGDLYFNTSANELKVYNGSSWQGGVTATGSFAATTGNTFTGDNTYNDGVKAIFGTGTDLLIYHDGSNSVIRSGGTGQLQIESSNNTNIVMGNAALSETIFKGIVNGAVELYFDNVKRLETTSTGIKVTGTTTTGSEFLGDFRVKGTDDSTFVTFKPAENLVRWQDNKKATFGNSNDLEISHDGSHSFIKNTTGHLKIGDANVRIMNAACDEDMIHAKQNEGVELYYDNSNKLQTSSTGVTINGAAVVGGNIEINQDAYFKLGASQDLQLVHDGSNSIIDNNTGDLIIRGDADDVKILAEDDILLRDNDDSTNFIHCINGGAVELYHNGTKKLETTANGIEITANEGGSAGIYLTADEGDDNGDKWSLYADDGSTITLVNYASGGWEKSIEANGNGNVELYYDAALKLATYSGGISVTGQVNSDGSHMGDSDKALFGDSNDLQIYHDGSNSYLDNTGTGDFYIRGNNVNSIILRPKQGENSIIANSNGDVELYYDNSKKFETYSTGVKWDGFLFCDDNSSIRLGNGADLILYHNGSHSKIRDEGTGNLYIESDDGNIYLRVNSNEQGVTVLENGAVELYYDNSKKLNTHSGGITVTGYIQMDGTEGSTAAGNIYIEDNGKLKLGNGGDLEIYHDGSHSYISNGTGNLFLEIPESKKFQVQHGTEAILNGYSDDRVELYYDNSKKLETTADGIILNGASDISHSDADNLQVGTGSGTNGITIYSGSDSNGIINFADGGSASAPYRGFIEYSHSSDHLRFGSAGNTAAYFDNSYHFLPAVNNSRNLGSSSLRWANVYTNDLNLSNEGSSNDVDGSWGDWTIQEGESDLFLKNNRSGKKYKFNLTEVS